MVTEKQIKEIKSKLPELPHERYKRYISDLKIPADAAAILTSDKYTSDFFEEALPHVKNPRILCNWIIVELYGRLKERSISLVSSSLKSKYLGNLVQMIEQKTITGRIAKQVVDDMFENPEKDSIAIVKENPDYQPVQDLSIIEPIVNEVIKNNAQSIVDFKAGRTKALSFLIGQVMKQTRGKASPDLVNDLIRKKMEEE